MILPSRMRLFALFFVTQSTSLKRHEMCLSQISQSTTEANGGALRDMEKAGSPRLRVDAEPCGFLAEAGVAFTDRDRLFAYANCKTVVSFQQLPEQFGLNSQALK